MDSILESIKKLLGIPEDYGHFDQDVVIHINSVLIALKQIGVGPEGGFSITGPGETWDLFLGSAADMEAVKSYVYLKVRLLFDPPQSSALIEAIKAQAAELEWRLLVEADGSTRQRL